MDIPEENKLFKHTRLNRVASQPVFARSTVTVSGFERNERATNMFMVQDPGFTLKSTVTSAIWFSANVVLNRMELLFHVRSTFYHMRLMPPQKTTHSVCMRHSLLNLSRPFSKSGKLDSCSTTLITVPVSLSSTLVIASLTTILLVLFGFSKYPTFPSNPSQSSARPFVNLSRYSSNFLG